MAAESAAAFTGGTLTVSCLDCFSREFKKFDCEVSRVLRGGFGRGTTVVFGGVFVAVVSLFTCACFIRELIRSLMDMLLLSSCFLRSRITRACCNSFLRVAGVNTCRLKLNPRSRKMLCFLFCVVTYDSVLVLKFTS